MTGATDVSSTGMGLVTPVGTSAAEVMAAMCEGRSGLRARPRASRWHGSLDVAAFGPPIDPAGVLPGPEGRVVDRYVVMALRAAADALADARIEVGRDVDPYRIGGHRVRAPAAWRPWRRRSLARTQRGPAGRQPVPAARDAADMGAARVAIRHGIRGYSSLDRHRLRGRRPVRRRGAAAAARR